MSFKNADGSREVWKVWGPLVALAVVAFGVTYLFLEPPPPKHFSLAAGSPGGAYHAFAEQYREILAESGYELEIVETAGSVENFELLRAGAVDLALLQGGVADPEAAEGAQSLASVFLEAVWLLYPADLGLASLADLEGLRVAIGAPGSGTRPLALQLLADHGLEVNDLEILDLPSDEARKALLAGRLDAAFFVSSAEAPWVAPILSDSSVRPLANDRQRAYEVRHRFLKPVTLGRGVLDLAADVPPFDVPMVAAAASLAGRRDLPASLVPLIIETLERVHADGGLLEEPRVFPSTRWVDLPLQTEARHYLDRGPSFLFRVLPFWAAAMADRLKILLLPLITLLIPIFKAAPPLYRWRIRSKIYRWYGALNAIDDALIEEVSDEDLDARIRAIESIEHEVISEVSVPLSYMDELYRLREHIQLVSRQLAERRRDRQPSGSATPP